MIMNQAIQIIAVPVLIGILLFLLPSAFRLIKAIITMGVVLFTVYVAIWLFGSENLVFSQQFLYHQIV